MTAPIDHSAFAVSGDPFIITATLWRGAMIDRFAQAEFFILRCLVSANSHGIALPPVVFTGLPKARISALDKILAERPDLAGSSSARKTLAALAALWELRNALSHGRIFTSKSTVKVCWMSNDKACLEDRELSFGLDEILQNLVQLESIKMKLGSQLGQFTAALKKAC